MIGVHVKELIGAISPNYMTLLLDTATHLANMMGKPDAQSEPMGQAKDSDKSSPQVWRSIQ